MGPCHRGKNQKPSVAMQRRAAERLLRIEYFARPCLNNIRTRINKMFEATQKCIVKPPRRNNH
jgi:hypothetical protein